MATPICDALGQDTMKRWRKKKRKRKRKRTGRRRRRNTINRLSATHEKAVAFLIETQALPHENYIHLRGPDKVGSR